MRATTEAAVGPGVGRAAAVAFTVAFVTLSLQILVHRMVSLKLVNNYAFLVISLTMLGFACSGVVLARMLPWVLARLEDTIATSAALLAITTVGASILFYHAGTSVYLTRSRPEFWTGFWQTMPLALLYAVPFVFAGFILGAFLSAPSLPVQRIYAWDLVGSAAGALVVIPLIKSIGVEWAVLAMCVLVVVLPLAILPPRRRPAWVAGVVALGVVVTASIGKGRAFDMRYPEGSMLAAARDPASGWVVEHGAWDPLTHIEVVRIPPPDASRSNFPALLGNDPQYWARITKMLTQNNWAFTLAPHYDGTAAVLRGVERTIFSAPYQVTTVQKPRVFVIGVGGGTDILAALAANAASVIAGEVNGATVDILTTTYRDYFRHWTEDPRVRLVHEEGRTLLAASPGPFDVITVSGVDTYAGTPAAAHVFSENYLYTDEAFDLYLQRLGPEGLLSVQRLEFVPPREMLRALTTAVAALRRAGVARPAEHILMVTMTNGRFTGMLVKKTPFDPDAARRLATWAASTGTLVLSAAPQINGRVANHYQVFLALGSAEREQAFSDAYAFDIGPISDDRPFFLHFSFWSHLLSDDPTIRRSIPAMEFSVLALGGLVGLVAIGCVLGPLLFAGRGGRRAGTARYAVYFAILGTGYLLAEIALIQKFGLFLGHPNYALSVVLAMLLLGTGIGALASDRLAPASRGLRPVAIGLVGLLLVEQFVVIPWLARLPAVPFGMRAAIVSALVLPVGIALGVFMPFGIDRLKRAHPGLVPWAWGINGIFSVLAPLAAVAISMTFGISMLLLIALPPYLVAALLLSGSSGPPAR